MVPHQFGSVAIQFPELKSMKGTSGACLLNGRRGLRAEFCVFGLRLRV